MVQTHTLDVGGRGGVPTSVLPMKRILNTLTEDPPEEDSPDLTDDEIEQAVPTKDPDDLARLIVKDIKEARKFTPQAHELRRRGSHLFWRTRLVCAKEPDRVLIYGVDWLGFNSRGDVRDGKE